MSRRFNAERAVTAAEKAERAAWAAFSPTPLRGAVDVATAPVKGDSFRGSPGLVWRYRRTSNGLVWADTGADMATGYLPDSWARCVQGAESVDAVDSAARIARRLVWERAAARLESALRAVEALPPAGHKRRKDGTVYRVQGPRQNAARKAGMDAWRRAMGRVVTTVGVTLAFVVLFFSACN